MNPKQILDCIPQDAKKGLLYGCAALGAYQLLRTSSDIVSGTWKHFLRPRRNLKVRYGKDDNAEIWAIVTGGASGLGFAYAAELLKEGFRILIIDKDEGALQDAGSRLNAHTILFDFAEVGTERGYDKLVHLLDEALQDKEVAVLVNNVAEFQSQPLEEASWNYILRASNVNGHSYAAMLKYFVPKMLKRQENFGKKSAIMNIGTCAAEPQNPRFQFSIYGASKAYDHIMSYSMYEMYGDKLDIMTVIPRQCATKMNTANYKYTVQPETHAKAAIDQLGYETVTYGPLTHCLEYNLRFKYQIFGLFDSYVQWCNKSRNLKLIDDYKKAA